MSALPASHRGSGAGPALDVSHGETRSVQTAAGRPERGLLRVGRQVATTGLLIVLVLALLAAVPGPHGAPAVVIPTAVVGGGTVLVASLPFILRSRARAPRWLRAIASGVGEAEQMTFTRHPSWRLVGAVGYLGFDIAVLWVALR